MALDRDQVGLLFKVNADTADAVQAFSLLRGVVEGMAAETSEQLQRMASRFGAVGDQVRQTGQQFRESFGDAARGQLAGYVGQFGLLGDAAAGMIPSLTGSAAGIAAIAGGAAAAGAAMAAAALSTANYAGSLNDLADVSNLELDTLQGLKAGAALVGESFESLTTSTVIFQKNIEGAKNGNKDLIETFKTLGVDLNGSVDDAFRQAIEQLSRMENGSQKTAMSTELFGKQATSLLKIMTEMDGSYSNLINKAREFGVLLTTEEIEAADQFGKQLDILKIKAEGFAFAVGNKVITALNMLGDAFVEAFDPDVARRMEEQLRQMGTLDAATRARLEGIDTGPVRDKPKTKETPTTTRAKTMATEILTDNRFYEQYLKNIQTQEQRLRDEQERLRVAAMTDEEARIIDAQRRIQENILRVRLDIAQNTEGTYSDTVLNLKLANLEQEATITNRKLLDLQAQRLAIEEAYEMDRNANIKASEERNRAEIQKTYEEQRQALLSLRELIEESRRQREQQLAADPSSPLSIFGAQGQEAADKGASIFGQISASASEAISSVSDQLGNFSSMMTDALNAVAGGLQNIIANFIITGRIGGAAFKALAAQIISAVTAQAAVKAIFELAEGFAANARYDFAAAAQHFTAAKFYGVVAGVAAAASVGLAAIGGGGGGANGTMFLGQDRRSGSAVMEQGGRRATEPQVIIIRAETEPGVMVSKFVQDYRANGEARSVLRRDLLGEF